MKKVYTELYYESDCGDYLIKVLKDDKVELRMTDGDLNAGKVELEVNQLSQLRNFINQFMIEHYGAEVAKPVVQHNPIFAPDPDGVLGF